MIEQPGVRVLATDSNTWSAEGPLAERALAFALAFAHSVRKEDAGLRLTPQCLVVENSAPEHKGLGTGTQLGLAVAKAVAAVWGMQGGAPELARRVGRGDRSALGIHGFEHGGFLVEAGKRSAEEVAPLVARVPFPDAWRIVLVLASRGTGLQGKAERDAFARLEQTSARVSQTDILCRLVLLGMLPALVERDWEGFGEALFDFNARVGERFAAVQGGVYADAQMAEVIAYMRKEGIQGAGQSSWGPTVFAVVDGEERAVHLAGRVQRHFHLAENEVLITRACNHGVKIEPR
jgi:beta-RFAP synthase